jgi:predicted regulator of Ras-like GTPase activity (Roadblock/LC7/MglB family)
MSDDADGNTTAVAEPQGRGRDFRALLHELVRLEHIRGGLIVAADGLTIAAELPQDISIEALAALAAMLGRELEMRGPRLRRGSFSMAHFAAEDGVVFLGGTPVGFIVLIGDAAADRDRIRHEMAGAMDAVRRAWHGNLVDE